jgi:tetratricopeptide (TPR) repeat protein/predicted aspartyl protease
MNAASIWAAWALAAVALLPVPAGAACKLDMLAELPVTMSGSQPQIAAKINGQDARFIVDSGAFWSMLTPAAAEQFKLRLRPMPANLTVRGIGGDIDAHVTTINELMIATVPVRHFDFVVGGSEIALGVAGLIGQNVLRIGDIEYDLANGVIRLMRANDCRKAELAYWAKAQPYSVMEIDWASAMDPHTTGIAYVNGAKIRVMFDSGAARSVLSLRAAERAGVRPGGPDVVSGGESGGVGRRRMKTWIGPFASFKIGDEEVRNTRLRIGEDVGANVDMLIGSDFLLSHRVYVASSQRKLYFTYNGGPVFNLETTAHATAAAASATTDGDAAGGEDASQPTDAAGFARRGAASAARRDYTRAIADLTRACELDPTESAYFYERGMARWRDRQLLPAVADFDQALKLKPGDVVLLVARAEARLAGGDRAGAADDVAAADAAAPKNANARLSIGRMYARLDRLLEAIDQYDLWIASHAEDNELSRALTARCWVRALVGRDLDKALGDCDAALKLNPSGMDIVDSRGLVHLRRGEFDKAIADYDAGLKLVPKRAWSLYGRGLAKQGRGLAAEGQADIAAAQALQPRIAADAKRYGIGP